MTLCIHNGACPVCHEWVDASKIITISRSSETGEISSKYLSTAKSTQRRKEMKAPLKPQQNGCIARETLESALTGAASAKLQAVLQELKEVWKLDPFSKVLIFSQYLGFLDILGSALQKEGIVSYRLDGKMNLKERVTALENFNKETSKEETFQDDGSIKKGSVFLVSMRAGGVGINLVAASTVFIVDPWWNSAVEDQCINRIHRIGQTADVVRVRKFVVSDSVEEKIVSLQRRKKDMACEILSDNTDGAKFSDTKPSLEDFKLLFNRH